jgi:hypothetical protein
VGIGGPKWKVNQIFSKFGAKKQETPGGTGAILTD